jgi:hypothetical protein
MPHATRSLQRWDLPSQLNNLYHDYSWQPWNSAPAFAYDDTRSWAALVAHVQESTYSSSGFKRLDERLRAQEKENIDKMGVCWRLTGYGELYEPDSDVYTTRDSDQAQIVRPGLRKRRQQYIAWLTAQGLDRLRELVDGAPVRMDKGKGAPYWAPASDHVSPLAYGRIAQTARTFAQLEQRVREAGNARMRFVQTSYIRVQGARKVRAVYAPGGPGLVQTGENYLPKVRRIGAMPFAVNHLMAAVGHVLRTAMSEIDTFNEGNTLHASKAVEEHRYNAALDFAGFDTTVSLETLEAVDSELFFPVIDWLTAHGLVTERERDLITDCAYHINYMSILLPPRNYNESAYVVQAEGQTRSGIQLTSWYGTEINRAFTSAKLAYLGYSRDNVKVFNYGDDTIVATDHADVIDKWAETSTYGGFVTTVAPDATYLMQRLPDRYSYLGRMFAATVNREPQHEPRSIIGAAAAFATRHALLDRHPLQDEYFRVLTEWGRGPDRFTEAIRMAYAYRDSPVQLTQLAMKHTLATQANVNTESLEQQVSNLVGLGAPGALAAAEQMATLLNRHRRSMPWAVFQRACADMPLSEANRIIKERSYTLRLQM